MKNLIYTLVFICILVISCSKDDFQSHHDRMLGEWKVTKAKRTYLLRDDDLLPEYSNLHLYFNVRKILSIRKDSTIYMGTWELMDPQTLNYSESDHCAPYIEHLLDFNQNDIAALTRFDNAGMNFTNKTKIILYQSDNSYEYTFQIEKISDNQGFEKE